MGPPHVWTIRKRRRMFVWWTVNVAVCIVYRITARLPRQRRCGLSILRESRDAAVFFLWKILKVNSCVDCMFSLWEGELVCKERLSVEFPGRYIDSFQSTLVSVGIIIPVVNDSASYRGICKHKGRSEISPIEISSTSSGSKSSILSCKEMRKR